MMMTPGDESPRPEKRARSEDKESAEPPYANKDTDLWFDDGNIILVSAESTGYRVHRSVLARNSEFFRDMLQLARPGNAQESRETQECTVLPLEDSTVDLQSFLNVFYTVGYFFPGKESTPYERLASLLRLATKYLCHNLRADIIAHFLLIYPSKRADILETHPLVPAAPAGAENWHHSLEAIVIARENDVVEFLPCAFYLACLLPLPAYIPYLSRLPIPDQYRLMNGRTRLTNALSPGTLQWQASGNSFYDCEDERCQRMRFKALQEALRRGPGVLRLFVEPMPHEEMLRASEDDEVPGYGQMCEDCCDVWESVEKKQYKTVWDQLPGYFSLGSWEDIKDEPVPNDVS